MELLSLRERARKCPSPWRSLGIYIACNACGSTLHKDFLRTACILHGGGELEGVVTAEGVAAAEAGGILFCPEFGVVEVCLPVWAIVSGARDTLFAKVLATPFAMYLLTTIVELLPTARAQLLVGVLQDGPLFDF